MKTMLLLFKKKKVSWNISMRENVYPHTHKHTQRPPMTTLIGKEIS